MLREKYNKSDWRSALDELESLPEETQLDNNALWTKLESRLEATKGRKTTWRYWAVAACTIGCIFFAGNRLNDNKEIAPIQLLVNTNTNEIKESVPVLSLEINKTIRPQINKKKKTVLVPLSGHIVIEKKQSPDPFVDAPVELLPGNMDSIVKPSTMLVNNIKKPIHFHSLNKKLPVVHINDLEKPIPNNQSVAENNGHVPFKVRLFERESSRNNPTNNQDGLINIKLNRSPQN